jgi:DNA-binding transcriptional LysR family regulator
MKLRHIEVINAVLQTGSLSAAARMLNISQPSASKHLQHAELTVGYLLFRRHAGRLHPTQELLQLAPSIRSTFASVDDVRRTAASLRGRPQARLRVGTVPSMSVIVPDAYEALHRKHPDVRCEFSTGHHHELMQWLLLREIDIGIAFDPPTHPALALEDLATQRLVCAARPEVLGKFRAAKTIDAAALATMPLIELLNTDPVGRLVGSYGERFEWRFPAPLVVKTHQVALELAARGLGVAVVDDLSASRFRQVLTVLPIKPQADIGLRAMFLHPGALSAAASNFIAACRAAIVSAQAE